MIQFNGERFYYRISFLKCPSCKHRFANIGYVDDMWKWCAEDE
jgi:hypothetical protein